MRKGQANKVLIGAAKLVHNMFVSEAMVNTIPERESGKSNEKEREKLTNSGLTNEVPWLTLFNPLVILFETPAGEWQLLPWRQLASRMERKIFTHSADRTFYSTYYCMRHLFELSMGKGVLYVCTRIRISLRAGCG